MKMRIALVSIVLVIAATQSIYCYAREGAGVSKIKVLVLDTIPSGEPAHDYAYAQQTGFVKQKLMELTVPQEKRLIDGINKLILLADNITASTVTHRVEKIELNIGIDANADAVLVNVGSSESIKVILSKK